MISEPSKSPDAGTLDFGEALHFLRQSVWIIAAAVGVALAAAAVYLAYARPVYAARAVLEVEPAAKTEASDADASDTLHTIELTIASQSVLLGVVRQLHLAGDPEIAPPKPGGAPFADAELVERLRRRVAVSLIRGSRLIALTAESADPEKARRIGQGIIDEFFRESWNERTGNSRESRELLLAEARRLGAELRSAEDRLQAYREEHRAVSLEDRQNIVVERLKDLNQQAAAAKTARLALESDRGRIEKLAGSDPESLLNLRDLAAVPEVADLRKELALRQAQAAALAKRYGPLHPTMIAAQNQISELRGALDRAIRKAADLVLQSYASAQSTEDRLETALAGQERTSLELDRIAIPYRALAREVKADDTMYQNVLDRLQQSNVSTGLLVPQEAEGDQLRVVEPPLTPLRPARPDRRLWYGLAAAGGLCLGCGAALARRALDRRLSSVDLAEAFLGLPALAAVPESSHRRLSSGPVIAKYPASAAAEAFRSLRTALSLLHLPDDGRCILFTSAVPGEGKSYCSMNYAAALAQRGWRTLLIDGDLRRPRQQQSFAAGRRSRLSRLFNPDLAKPGLSACLRDPAAFAGAVQPTSTANLFLLGDAAGAAEGGDLLARGGFEEVLRRSLAAYDRVVVDSAPLIAVSDALHLAKHIRTVCLVIHSGKTPRRLVRRSCQLLEEVAQRPPVGVLLNLISSADAANYRSYYDEKAYA